MRTEAQKEASRINGAKSRGPVTPEGKAISSRNALRHGATAEAIVLTNEDPAIFVNLNADYDAKFNPIDNVERDFVDEMVIARWRLRRDWINETALIDLEMDRQDKDLKARFKTLDHPSEYAFAFKALADQSKALQLNARYETNHRRAFYRALKGLMDLRAMMKAVSTPAEPQPEPTPEPQLEPIEESVQPQQTKTENAPANSPKNDPEPKPNEKCETNPPTEGTKETKDEKTPAPDRQVEPSSDETRYQN